MVCLFRPILILYLFSSLIVISCLPGLSEPQSYLQIFKVGSINVFAFDFAIGLMFCVLFILVLKHIRLQDQAVYALFQAPLTRIILLMFVWDLFIGYLSLQKGFDPQNVLRKLSKEALMFMVLFIPLIPDLNVQKDRFFKFTVWLGLTLLAFAFIRYFITGETVTTSSGTIRSLGGNETVIFMFPVCYLLFYSNLWKTRKVLSIAAVLLMSFGITFTGHRSGYIVLLFVFCAYYLLEVREKIRYLWVPAFGLAILVLVLFIPASFNIRPGQDLAQDMLVRFSDTFDLQNKTTRERLSYWQYANNVLAITPVLGLGRFPAYSTEISHVSEYPSVMIEGSGGIVRAAHNFIVDKFIHEGFSGLAILILFLTFLLKTSFEVSSKYPRYGNFLMVYILMFFIFCLFNTPFTTGYAALFYFAAGFLNAEALGREHSRILTKQNRRMHFANKFAPTNPFHH